MHLFRFTNSRASLSQFVVLGMTIANPIVVPKQNSDLVTAQISELSFTQGLHMNSDKASRPFSSAHSLAELVIILLAICATFDVVAIATGCYQVMLLSREQADLITNNDILPIIRTLQLIARFTAFIVFLIWFYRAHRNLQALGIRRGRYSSPWTVLLFLVPILNLYYAYDLVKELWRQSSPDLGFSDAFLKQPAFTLEHYPSKTALIGLWWGFTVASIVAARISLMIISHSPGISDKHLVSGRGRGQHHVEASRGAGRQLHDPTQG